MEGRRRNVPWRDYFIVCHEQTSVFILSVEVSEAQLNSAYRLLGTGLPARCVRMIDYARGPRPTLRLVTRVLDLPLEGMVG